MTFDHSDLIALIETVSPNELDTANFGVIGFDENCVVVFYNQTESLLSGLRAETVVGSHLFIDVAPCMNNYLVALKFEERDELDEIIPYILSFKMKPVPVSLRLIKHPHLTLNYVLIRR